MATPWQISWPKGPKVASRLIPKAAGRMIARAKRPLFIVGVKSAEEELDGKKLIDYVIEIAKAVKNGVTVVATGHTVKEFLDRGFEPDSWMGALDITNRIRDPEWKGLDGAGPYDLVAVMGIPYPFQAQILSTMKHFTPGLLTISLDRYYHPNARFSFQNLHVDKWKEGLEEILKIIKGEE